MPKTLNFELTNEDLAEIVQAIKHDKRPEVRQRANILASSALAFLIFNVPLFNSTWPHFRIFSNAPASGARSVCRQGTRPQINLPGGIPRAE